MQQPPPCFGFLQSHLHEVDSGNIIVRFSPTPEMTNPNGVVQGGILAGMLDNVIGATLGLTQPQMKHATIQMNIQFFHPVRAGETILGRARIERQSSRHLAVEAWLTAEAESERLVQMQATHLIFG